jgi:hypothetical protein
MARLIATPLLLLTSVGLSLAQEAEPGAAGEDLTLPPVIAQSPGDAHLEPTPENREDTLEAVVTGGQTDWRLPDLGTSLREEEEPELDQRMDFRAAPLYDPEKQVEMLEPVPVVDVERNVGYLRLFQIDFGRRSLPDQALPDDAGPDDAEEGESTQHEPPRN